MHTQDLALADARALIARAIDKAEDLGVRGAVAVVGASGVLVSASRMDRGGTAGMARARSKAWIAATQQMPSAEHLRRMTTLPFAMERGFVATAPEAAFPGAGGMPLADEHGAVVAGIAASGATVGPFVAYPGADRRKLIADGRPANCEDLIVHYALGIPYAGQHGDDEQRWLAAYGAPPGEPGLGMAAPPRASRQPELAWALELADSVLAAARAGGHRIAVAIVDPGGDPIQQDRSDGAPAAAPHVAQAVAACAAAFGAPSPEVDPALAALLPLRAATVAGGLPVTEGDRVVAGLGVGGAPPPVCQALAAAALA
jgi:uncharacterized protein GlcG (DUF336 family)